MIFFTMGFIIIMITTYLNFWIKRNLVRFEIDAERWLAEAD